MDRSNLSSISHGKQTISNWWSKSEIGAVAQAAPAKTESGGIAIYIAAEKPEGVPEENWLPINRKDENLDVIMRVYQPELEKMKTWGAPKAEKLN
jgi:hypothetical protein